MEKLDQFEAAEQLTTAWTEASIKSYSDLVPTPVDLEEDETVECDLCWDELPRLRAVKGFTTCVSCQRDIEKRSNQYGRKNSREWE